MNPSALQNEVVVFSGGSAANSLTDVFNNLIKTKSCGMSYVIPISDNGGSTSELIRVFGGPGIGDVRSRLVRLIPSSSTDTSRRAIRDFFNHRLTSDPAAARAEWLDIVEARHPLWDDISSARKELIRSFLNLVNLEIVKRARPTSVFNFGSASVGNLFLTGARLFSGSFEAAIYLLSSICSIPSNIHVLPAINTNFSHHICAGLADGTTITGQNAISHPSEATDVPISTSTSSNRHRTFSRVGHASDVEGEDVRSSLDDADTIEDANWPGSLPSLRKPYITFSKTPPPPPAPSSKNEEIGFNDVTTIGDSSNDQRHSDILTVPIERLWYINPYGQEIRPFPNPQVISSLRAATSIIYSIGSLYTSLVPSLILRGVGDAIAFGAAKQKILILNGSLDRETSSSAGGPYTGMDFVRAIVRACQESRGIFDREAALYTEELRRFVTHVVYIEEEGAPVVSKRESADAGIEVVRVYGRRMEGGGGWRYDERGLEQALEALVGKGRSVVSRRNTLVG